jgi:hypothetical protein
MSTTFAVMKQWLTFKQVGDPADFYPGDVREAIILWHLRPVGFVEGAKGQGFTAVLDDGRTGHGATRVSAASAALTAEVQA